MHYLNLTELRELRSEIETLAQSLDKKRRQLHNIESICPHRWAESKKEFVEVTEFVAGKLIPRGSDIDYEYNSVKRTIPQWSRECTLCGKVEKTTSEKTIERKVPNF